MWHDISKKHPKHIVQAYIDDVCLQFSHFPSDAAAFKYPQNVGHVHFLMALAHLVNLRADDAQVHALEIIKTMLHRARRTSSKKRTDAQKFMLTYWRDPLSQHNDPRSRIQYRLPLVVYADASEWGIGITLPSINLSLAWFWDPNCNRIPKGRKRQIVTSWSELIAVEVAIHTVITMQLHDTAYPTIILSDNRGVVDALTKWQWTDAHGLHNIVGRIYRTCMRHEVMPDIKWIPSYSNIADRPSRGNFMSKKGVKDMVKWWKKFDRRWKSGKAVMDVPKPLAKVIIPAFQKDVICSEL